MPIFILRTNVSSDKVTADAVKSLSTLVAQALGKPESYVAIHIVPDQEHLIFGGSSDPCGIADLNSIGALGGAKNKKLSEKISSYLEAQFGIPKDRCYINFTDIPPADCGFNGSTFG